MYGLKVEEHTIKEISYPLNMPLFCLSVLQHIIP